MNRLQLFTININIGWLFKKFDYKLVDLFEVVAKKNISPEL